MLLLLTSCFLLPRGGDTPIVVAVPPEPGCDDMAVAALYVEVRDLDGAALEPSTLEWRIAGEQWAPADCWDESCTSWVAGWNVAGDMEVRASLSGTVDGMACCEHIAEAEARVTIVWDDWGCHPESQEIALELDTQSWECLDSGC